MPLKRSAPSAVAVGLVLSGVCAAASSSAAEPTKAACIAANESAQDLRGAGKLLEARSQLAVCVSETCPGPVRQDCAARLADVDKALPTLVLVAKDASDGNLAGVRATIDGKALAGTLNGTAIPLDPGEHHVVLEADGQARVEKTLVLHEGEKARREVVVFAAPAPAAPAPTEAPSPEAAPPDAAAEQAPGAPPGHTQRLIGLALGGVGAVGVVVGGILGLVAKSTYDHGFNDECHGQTQCSSAQGVSDVQSANGQATASTVGFVAGGVLLAAGAAVYLTAPRGEVAVGPAVGSGAAGLSVRGTW